MENFKTGFSGNFSYVAKYVENYAFKSIFYFFSKEKFSFSTDVGKSWLCATLGWCFQQPFCRNRGFFVGRMSFSTYIVGSVSRSNLIYTVGAIHESPENIEFPIAFDGRPMVAPTEFFSPWGSS